MTEYYATSSLTMASAAVVQGFEKTEFAFSGDIEWHITHGAFVNYKVADKWRFPKTPHNVALMDNLENDVIKTPANQYQTFDNTGCGTNTNGTIIYRNNLPFPVWDKETI